MTWEFLLTSLLVVVMPGTGATYTMAIGLGRGFWPSVVAAFGCTLSIVPHIFASIVGIAAILHTSALAFQVVKYLGVAYLLYMAFSMLREGGMLDVKPKQDNVSHLKLIRDGITINVLNPKLSVFFLSFLPQFVPTGTAHPTLNLTLLGLTFMAMTFAVFILYGALASAARDYVISRPVVVTWMKRTFAGAFALLGARLAFAER
ncbi:MAG: LysE family translocator [Pseudomonadota bacterium]